MSDIKPSTPGPSDTKTGSTVAKALANVANIGSVGSGRKLSDNNTVAPAESAFDNDPPPTYSSVAVQNSPNLNESRSVSKDSMDPISVSSNTQNDCEVDRLLQPCQLVNGRSSLINGTNLSVLVNGHDPVIINGNMDSFSTSKPHSPPPNKTSKKRMSWFGSKRDSWNSAEPDSNGAADTEEEKRRKKIKWLWRSAAFKSTAKRREQLDSQTSSIS